MSRVKPRHARPIERFTLGVEEEYRIVDGTTPALAGRQADVLPRAERELGSAVAPEFQQPTIEVATHICSTLAGVRRELERARTRVVSAARERGSRIAAKGHASVFRLARADDYRQAAVSRDRSAVLLAGLARALARSVYLVGTAARRFRRRGTKSSARLIGTLPDTGSTANWSMREPASARPRDRSSGRCSES